MPTFENTDAAFTPGAPFPKLLEPTLLLPLLAGGALGVMARNRYPADAHLLSLGFVSRGKESRIRRYGLWSASELFDMLLQTSFQQGGVGRPLLAHVVMRNDLVLRLLHHDQLAELIGLVRLTLANHLGVRLQYAEQLAVGLGVGAEHPLPCLAQDLLHPRNHLIQLLLGFVQYGQIALLDALADLLRKLLGLPGHPAGNIQQFDVGVLHLLPALLGLVPAGTRNRQHLQLGGPAAVAHLRTGLTRHGGDFLHDARQHAYAVTQ